MLSCVGFPAESRAGLKRARNLTSRHVVESRAADPLEAVMAQAATRPSLPMSIRNSTVPSSLARTADGG
jgi:hypothetical protein